MVLKVNTVAVSDKWRVAGSCWLLTFESCGESVLKKRTGRENLWLGEGSRWSFVRATAYCELFGTTLGVE
jgi:hypothetical protein